jgi:1,4-dihydroxy-2-naphthoate polyprenyltransferase
LEVFVIPFQVILEAARPKTLPACAAPVVLGTAVAHHQGHAQALPAALALLCALSLQLGTNFANDYFDAKNGADTKERLGPRRAVQAGLVTPAQMKGLTAIAFGAACIFGVAVSFLSHPGLLVVGAMCLLAGYFYTGGKRPWGYLGLGDILVFVFFGLVAVCGTVFVQGARLADIDATALLCGCAAGFLSTAILVVNNLRDRHTDVIANKNTLAVRFGARFARAEYAACVFLPFVIVGALAAIHQKPTLFLPLLSLPIAVVAFRNVRTTDGAALNPWLGRTAQLLLAFCVTLSIGFVL